LGVSVVSLPSSGTAVDALLLHGIPDHYFPRSKHELGMAAAPDMSSPDSHLTRRSATYEGIANDLPPPDPLMNYSVGVTAAVVAAVVSGLAGVYFEKLLKESPTQASVWVRNVQLSFYSLIAAFFGGVVWQDGAGIREHGFFEGYNAVVWAAVVLQAAGGLIASLVIRDADNIVKNFATSISIVISFVVSVWAFKFTVTVPVRPSITPLCPPLSFSAPALVHSRLGTCEWPARTRTQSTDAIGSSSSARRSSSPRRTSTVYPSAACTAPRPCASPASRSPPSRSSSHPPPPRAPPTPRASTSTPLTQRAWASRRAGPAAPCCRARRAGRTSTATLDEPFSRERVRERERARASR